MLQRLVIVSHVIHYQHQGLLYAYGPYAREIDIWADLFLQVLIASPCRREPPPGDAVAFTRPNISIVPIAETGGETLASKIAQVFTLPLLVGQLAQAMLQADAIHVRCPGNLGLLGVMLAPIFSRYRVAKYAGQWNGYTGEPFSGWLQRFLLRSSWWRAPVTVYGAWPNQPDHIVPFFTSMMTDEQMQRACEVAATKQLASPLHILFSGRLANVKRVDVLLEAVNQLAQSQRSFKLVILGDGPERSRLERYVEQHHLRSSVEFVGALPYDDALQWYEWAHCLVLPSTHSEGWPKVVAEAMAYGLLAIAVDHGQVSSMLTDRGILLKNGSAEEIAAALAAVIDSPEAFTELMKNGARWAQRYSLDGLRSALQDLLAEHWGDAFAVGTNDAERSA